MNALSFNVRSYDKYVIVNMMEGNYNSEDYLDHNEAESLAEYLLEVTNELRSCVGLPEINEEF